jgi:hypothetical protein
LTAHYAGYSLNALSILLGKKLSSIKNKVRLLKLKKPQAWSAEETARVKREFPHVKTADLARAMGKATSSLQSHANGLGLKKTPECLAQVYKARPQTQAQIATRFQPGKNPWNANIKGYIGRNKTSYQKGNIPHTCAPVGTVAVTSDGYWRRKTAMPNRWVFLHRENWEKAHGPIPNGHVVIFKDGNKDHYAIENLEILSRAQFLERHTYARYPGPLRRVAKVLKTLKQEIEQAHVRQ